MAFRRDHHGAGWLHCLDERAACVSLQAFFDAARDLKRELSGSGLSQADVDALNAVIGAWPPLPTIRGLGKPSQFYQWLRSGLGQLNQSQVDGINALLTAMGKAR